MTDIPKLFLYFNQIDASSDKTGDISDEGAIHLPFIKAHKKVLLIGRKGPGFSEPQIYISNLYLSTFLKHLFFGSYAEKSVKFVPVKSIKEAG